MSTTRPTPPSAKDYADAFYDMEGRIHRVVRLSRIADYLASLLEDDIENKRPGPHDYLAKLTADAAAEVLQVANDLDEAHLERFNDLVGRENDANDPIHSKVPMVGKVRS